MEYLDRILEYFPELTEKQRGQMEAMGPLYKEWNQKINVVSRKDIDSLYLHHVLHSLALARVLRPEAGARIMDLGCGGGFPGIPLAVLFPECHFHLVDSIGKKLLVASEVAKGIGLENVSFCHERAEQEKGRFDYVVSRAVMMLEPLWKLCRKNIKDTGKGNLAPGLICLKGGDLQEEIAALGREASRVRSYDVSDFFQEDFFVTKKVIYLPV